MGHAPRRPQERGQGKQPTVAFSSSSLSLQSTICRGVSSMLPLLGPVPVGSDNRGGRLV